MEVTRREFLRLGATGVGGLGISPLGFDITPATRIKQDLRIEGASVSHSVCPYCAVGCALLAYTRKAPDGKVELLQIEGDPDSPVNEGRLCPKGASALAAGRLPPAGRQSRSTASPGRPSGSASRGTSLSTDSRETSRPRATGRS